MYLHARYITRPSRTWLATLSIHACYLLLLVLLLLSLVLVLVVLLFDGSKLTSFSLSAGRSFPLPLSKNPLDPSIDGGLGCLKMQTCVVDCDPLLVRDVFPETPGRGRLLTAISLMRLIWIAFKFFVFEFNITENSTTSPWFKVPITSLFTYKWLEENKVENRFTTEVIDYAKTDNLIINISSSSSSTKRQTLDEHTSLWWKNISWLA